MNEKYVIKNTKVEYDSYLTKDEKWSGLLNAIRLDKSDAITLVESKGIKDCEILSYDKVIGVKRGM